MLPAALIFIENMDAEGLQTFVKGCIPFTNKSIEKANDLVISRF